jgi:hypothetical protein
MAQQAEHVVKGRFDMIPMFTAAAERARTYPRGDVVVIAIAGAHQPLNGLTYW